MQSGGSTEFDSRLILVELCLAGSFRLLPLSASRSFVCSRLELHVIRLTDLVSTFVCQIGCVAPALATGRTFLESEFNFVAFEIVYLKQSS